jgi:large subunit ribosomal protein L10
LSATLHADIARDSSGEVGKTISLNQLPRNEINISSQVFGNARIKDFFFWKNRRNSHYRTLTIRSEKTTKERIFMAISRDKKNTLVAEMSETFSSAKMTVFAQYQGLSVADVQELRGKAREAGVVIKVVKNRLVRVAMASTDTYKETDTSPLTGQLLYAISSEDEVAPAQVLDAFAKTHPALQFVGAFSGEGALLSAAEVTALAGLPSKNQLIGQVVSQLLSPVHDVTNALSGNLHALLDGVEAKATS